ncbi:hypothetical protein BCR44DRAFT_1505053 [Catenaria anguillulae PL171]|uniref:Uncharacterized protein n=1 Tax=Catenaria anguillulae PL171 TaxID=765915 RepID=A0A1Y2H573_9FUNG|nr:hypothetical protein BCR44DRAFT_1505053 [Catenaria anguillulae PL171]
MQRTPSSHLAASGSAHHLPGSHLSTGGNVAKTGNNPILRPHSPSNLTPPPVPFHLLSSDDDEDDVTEPPPEPGVAQQIDPNDASSTSKSAANDTFLPLTSLFSSLASTVSALAGGATAASSGPNGTATSSQVTLTPTITTPDGQPGSNHHASENVISSTLLVSGTSSGSMHVSQNRRPLSPSLSRSSSRQMSNTSIHAGTVASSGTPSSIRRTPSMVASNTPLPGSSGSHSHLAHTHVLDNSHGHSHHYHSSLSHNSRSRNASLVLPSSTLNHSRSYLSSSTSSTHMDPTQDALHDSLMQQLADRDARIAQLEEQLRHLASTDTANQRLIADLEQQISELTTGKRQATQDLAVAKRELASNLTTLSKAQDERDAHLARVRDLESDLDRIKQIASGLSERLALAESRVSDLEHEEAEAKQQVVYWQQQAEELHGICDRLTAELEHRESILDEIDLGLSHALGEQMRRASPAAGNSRSESPSSPLQAAAGNGKLKASVTALNDSTMTLQPTSSPVYHAHLVDNTDSVSKRELGQQEQFSSTHTISTFSIASEQLVEPPSGASGDVYSTPSDTLESVHNPKAAGVSVGRLETSGLARPTAMIQASETRTATISSDSIPNTVSSTQPAPVHLTTQPQPPEIRRQRSLQDELMVATSSSHPPEPSASPLPLGMTFSVVQNTPVPKAQPQLHAILTRIASRVYKHRHTLGMSDSDFDSFLGFLDDKAGVTFVHVLRAIASSGSRDEEDDMDDGGISGTKDSTMQKQREQESERPPDSAYVGIDEPTPGKFELSKHSLADLLHQDHQDEHVSCSCHSHSDSHTHSDVHPASALKSPSSLQPSHVMDSAAHKQQSIWRSILAVYALNLLHLTGARVKQATIPNDIDNPRMGKHVVFSVSPTPETGLFTGKWAVLNGWIGSGSGGGKLIEHKEESG